MDARTVRQKREAEFIAEVSDCDLPLFYGQRYKYILTEKNSNPLIKSIQPSGYLRELARLRARR